jgi:penicillin amidase
MWRAVRWFAAGLAVVLGVGLVVGWRAMTVHPHEAQGETQRFAGLHDAVEAARRPDGVWRIEAVSEHDAMFAVGFLQARDRTAQLDILRHVARGEAAALVGNRAFGEDTAVDLDVRNRFLGFADEARWLWERASPAERDALAAYVAGVNAWLAQSPLPPEHRLLRTGHIRPWRAEDSLAIYGMLMHSLASNADREIRRLAMACAASLDAVERIWPTDIVFMPAALPAGDLLPPIFPVPPAVVPEMAAELGARCREGGVAEREAQTVASTPLALLGATWSASNNWVVDGSRTVSGRPILSSDPHLPHMNPPLVWAVDVSYDGHRVAGFVMAGMHRIAFGHNGFVAWGATTNHVDRQDLVVHRRRVQTVAGREVEGYELDGRFEPFELRTERFAVRGGEPVEATVRFTRDGPLVNDLEPFVRGRIPLTALRRVPVGRGGDLDAARAMTHARSAAALAEALDGLDAGCQSWVFADAVGSIGYRGPCLVPLRVGWRGTFPVPGWTRRYDWQGFMPKEVLPASDDPLRGWLASANAQIVPPDAFPTTYNADTAASDRFSRIAWELRHRGPEAPLDAAGSARIQLDLRQGSWPRIRGVLASSVCSAELPASLETARQHLCLWNGRFGPHSTAAGLFVLWTNALVDRALADELPGGAESPLWHWVVSLHQFEADVGWLLLREPDDPVWDDVRTPARESRDDVMRAAFEDAVAAARTRWGDDVMAWRWGTVRPFVLHHLFSSGDGPLGWWLDSAPYAVGGGPETVFKNQFSRADRERLRPIIGPILRFTIDFADPWGATYSMAGGESGWPSSPYYGNLVADWAVGRGRRLTPEAGEGDVTMRLLPPGGGARRLVEQRPAGGGLGGVRVAGARGGE